jgi:hypothetical protein
LHCGADAANDNSVFGYCSGSDPAEDYAATEAGFDLWNLTNGGRITLPILSSVLQKYSLHAGKPSVPDPEAELHWPYTVGTFDGNGSWFAHR